MLDAGLRRNPVAAVPRHAILVDEAESSHAEKGFFREAGRTGLGCLDERESGRMGAEENLDRRGGTLRLGAGGSGAQKFQKLLAGMSGEAIGGMADVGVNMFGQLEAYGHAPRIGVGIVIGDHGQTGGVGETHRNGRGLASDVRRAGERCRPRRRREGAGQQKAFGVSRAVAGMRPEHGVEQIEEIVS